MQGSRQPTHLSRWFPTTTSFSSTMFGWRRRRSSVISRRLLMGTPATQPGLSERPLCRQGAPGPHQLPGTPAPTAVRALPAPSGRLEAAPASTLTLPSSIQRQTAALGTDHQVPQQPWSRAEPRPQWQPRRGWGGQQGRGAHSGCRPRLGWGEPGEGDAEARHTVRQLTHHRETDDGDNWHRAQGG